LENGHGDQSTTQFIGQLGYCGSLASSQVATSMQITIGSEEQMQQQQQLLNTNPGRDNYTFIQFLSHFLGKMQLLYATIIVTNVSNLNSTFCCVSFICKSLSCPYSTLC